MKYTDEIILENAEGLEIEIPSRYEVCPNCEGHGTHLNTSMREHAYTPEEFNESFDDEEKEHYFRRGGMYDVVCEKCEGKRVVLTADESRMTPEIKKLWDKHLQEERNFRAVEAAERKMGA